MTDQVLVRIYMSEEDLTKCLPSHQWSSCHPPTSEESICLATGKCPVCSVTFWAPPVHCPPLLRWAPMRLRWKCPTSVPPVSWLPTGCSDHTPTSKVPAPSLRDKLKCVRPISDNIGRKWKIHFPTSFRPVNSNSNYLFYSNNIEQCNTTTSSDIVINLF